MTVKIAMWLQGAAGGSTFEEGYEEQCWENAAPVGITGRHHMVLRAALHVGASISAGRQ